MKPAPSVRLSVTKVLIQVLNNNAPFHVKLDVLDTCVTSSLLYGCETWANCNNDVEQPYRSGLKIALNVRQNLNNEIVHVETGKFPLCGKVKSTQLKFWLFAINKYVVDFPESAVAKVVKMGMECNSKYLKHYTDLQATYENPTACKEVIGKVDSLKVCSNNEKIRR